MVGLKWIVVRLIFEYSGRGLAISTTDSNDLMLAWDQVVIMASYTIGINVFIHHHLHATRKCSLFNSLQQMFLVAHQKIGLLLQNLKLIWLPWASLRFVALIHYITAFVVTRVILLLVILIVVIYVVIVSLRHLLIFVRYTGHTRHQLMPLRLMTHSILHLIFCLLSIFVGSANRLEAGGSSVTLRLYISCRYNFLNILRQVWLIGARTTVLDSILVEYDTFTHGLSHRDRLIMLF